MGRSNSKWRCKWRCAAAALPWLAAPLGGQATPTVTPAFDTTQWVAPQQAIELHIAGGSVASGSRIAVMVGSIDLTALFRASGDTLRYQPQMLRLPSGEQQLAVYVVSGDQTWTELARYPLRVLTPSGYQQADVLPRLTLNLKGQVAEGHAAAADAPPRADYQDLVIGMGLQTLHRSNALTMRSQLNVLGTTNRAEALRFGELASAAPKLDLADYEIAAERRGLGVTLGHQTFGQQRHLASAFGSRGIGTAARLGEKARLSFAALNGNTVVGWSNPLGVARSGHRILGGSLALDVVPRRPGLVQLEGTVLDGSVLPTAAFNQGVVNDAEESEGSALRLIVGDPSRRVQIEAGLSRSRSDLREDSLLSQGESLVGVTRVARNARYIDATVSVLRGARLTRSATANLAITFKHERVDPLYRTVASPIRADVEEDGVGVQGEIGVVAVRGNVMHTRDNLARVPSILTTRTRLHTGSVAIPLASLLPAANWLPLVSYDLAHTAQAGQGVPVNSEFAATHVPDQRSANQSLAVQWQRTGWSVGYRLNLTRQDNRQPGRENADFATSLHNVTLVATGARVDVSVDLGLDGTTNEELSQRTATRRAGGVIDWRLTSSLSITAAYSYAAMTMADTARQHVSDGRFEVAQRLPLLRLSARSSPAQLFARFTRHDETLSAPLTAAIDRHTWYVSTGLTLGVF
jgi:hypothetical protein